MSLASCTRPCNETSAATALIDLNWRLILKSVPESMIDKTLSVLSVTRALRAVNDSFVY